MTSSPTRAPGTRQLLLTFFLWVPVCITKGQDIALSFFLTIYTK